MNCNLGDQILTKLDNTDGEQKFSEEECCHKDDVCESFLLFLYIEQCKWLTISAQELHIIPLLSLDNYY